MHWPQYLQLFVGLQLLFVSLQLFESVHCYTHVTVCSHNVSRSRLGPPAQPRRRVFISYKEKGPAPTVHLVLGRGHAAYRDEACGIFVIALTVR
jgi:hypothetical protein